MRLPRRIDQPADVGDRPHQVVDELRLPAADEGIRLGDAETGEDIDALLEPDVVALDDLQRDRNPVARRRHRQHRVVRPEARDGALLRGHVLLGLVDLERLLVVLGGSDPRCSPAAAAARRWRRSAWRRCGSCPSRAEAGTAAGRSGWSAPNRPAPASACTRAGSPCSRRPRRRHRATTPGYAPRPPRRRPRCGRRHRPATPCGDLDAQLRLERGHGALAGRAGVGEEVLHRERHAPPRARRRRRRSRPPARCGTAARPFNCPARVCKLPEPLATASKAVDADIGEGAAGDRRRIGRRVPHQCEHQSGTSCATPLAPSAGSPCAVAAPGMANAADAATITIATFSGSRSSSRGTRGG